LSKGLIVKSTGSWYYVKDGNNPNIPCKIKGNFRIRGIRATNPVAVGDLVEYDLMEEGTGVITQIYPRKNYIIRKASNLSRDYQLIASNIDKAILLITLTQPKTLLGFIDRFLVSAEAFRIPVILIFNKTDLYSTIEKEYMADLISIYKKIGYHCLSISLKNGNNLDQLLLLFKDQVSVIAGNSGVGKSTLINFLDPSLNARTSVVSEYHKSGKHTTANAEMYFLPDGGSLIDTPGIKGFGMVDIEKEELFHFFPEIFEYSKYCKYNNCLHANEPDCAVINAVLAGEISESRYMNYLDLLMDIEDKYRK
jgi:ribosome biogenesis GTPase